jgi:general secretion pathway protein D
MKIIGAVPRRLADSGYEKIKGEKMRWIALVYLFSYLLVAQESKVSMDFQGVDMTVFLQWFAHLSNKKIILSEGRQTFAQKKIYLYAHEPVPTQAVEKICLSLLESNGFTLVKVGQGGSEVYKLVESDKAASKPIAIYSPEEFQQLESGDYYVSQLLVIKYLKVEQIIASLRQAKLLDPQAGSMVEIKGANALIISDFFPNVQRVVKIVEMLDKEPPKVEVAFVTLKFAKADEVSQKLQQVFQNKARELAEYYSPSGTPTIVPDSRTNSLTIRGAAEDIREIKKLIAHFDREIKESEIVAKLYSLQHVTPEKILPTLREFINTPVFREKSVVYSTSQPGTPQISVIANDHAKTLLITAPKASHKLLHDVIMELDIRRPQVLLEAVICEFTPTDVLNLGIELMRLDDINEDEGIFGHPITSFGLSSIVDEAGNPITPQKPGTPFGRALAPGSGLTAFLTKDRPTNIPILLRTLQSVSQADVISVPRILTDDGERAEIRVQQEEPVTSINALNPTTTTTSFKEFVSAGTVLIIKPHIIHKTWLRLEIEQEIEAFVGSPPSAGVPPPKSSRSLKTVVTVPNKHLVILGGLCGRREVETIDKIPFLGDIPILGLLFQSRSRSLTKTNLYIFIQPKILDHPEFNDLKGISEEEREKVRNLQPHSLEEQGFHWEKETSGENGGQEKESLRPPKGKQR